jgi:hypothetical protein
MVRTHLACPICSRDSGRLSRGGRSSGGPAAAYKYFKGESIKHPLGYDITIDTPLDFGG